MVERYHGLLKSGNRIHLDHILGRIYHYEIMNLKYIRIFSSSYNILRKTNGALQKLSIFSVCESWFFVETLPLLASLRLFHFLLLLQKSISFGVVRFLKKEQNL